MKISTAKIKEMVQCIVECEMELDEAFVYMKEFIEEVSEEEDHNE